MPAPFPPAPLLSFALQTPQNDAAAGAVVDHIEVREVHVKTEADPALPQFPNGHLRIFFGAVGDPRTFDVLVALSPAQQTNFQNGAKNAIQTKTGLTLV